MYHPIPPQPDCVAAWRAAVELADNQSHHEAHNVVFDVENPLARSTLAGC